MNTHLKKLNVDSNEMGVAGSEAIENFLKVNPTLIALSLSYTSIDSSNLMPINNGLKTNSSLKVIDLGGNPLGPIGAKLMATELKDNRSLTKLGLYNAKIGDEGCISLVNNLNSSLMSLELQDNALTDASADALISALTRNKNLKFNLLGNNLSLRWHDTWQNSKQTH